MEKKSVIILGVSIAIGLIVLGFCIKSGLNSFSDKERIVTVKGLAEKIIEANTADIEITCSVSGDYPSEIVKRLDKEIEKNIKTLASRNYKNVDISELSFYDSKSYYSFEWDGGQQIKVKKDRYYLSKKIIIRANEVENAELVKEELLLTLFENEVSSQIEISVVYYFAELNDFKSELIAESTKNARISGEQFANDSKSKLGKIKTASQGQISIVGSYYGYGEEMSVTAAPSKPYQQKVRVVSTIVFFLED